MSTKTGSGRPSKFKPEYIGICERASRVHGLTQTELAKLLGVGVSTLKDWMQEHEALAEAIRTARWAYDSREIETALAKRAKGYRYVETRITTVVIDGQRVERERIATTKHVPGDVTAMIFWLKNRESEHWKDVRGLDVKLKDRVPVEASPALEKLIEEAAGGSD